MPWLSMGCGGTKPLRFSGIPDGDKRALKTGYETVARHLSRALGAAVEYTHVPDYTAAVTALATGAVDFAWLGGVTTVQAESRTPGGVHFVAARSTDLHFKSYLIANREVAARKGLTALQDRSPGDLAALAALAPQLRGSSFSFGSKNSTSGHVMPRAFFSDPAVGLNPETDFAGGATYQLKGGHAATMRAVASAAVDFGVVNFAAWEAADASVRTDAPVVAVTPEYVDYCLVANARMPMPTVEKLRGALLGLDPADAADAEVLAAFSASRFVAVDPEDWDGIRGVLARWEPGAS